MKHLLQLTQKKTTKLIASIVSIYAMLFCFSSLGLAQSVMISQYIETNSGTTPKGVEIFNYTSSDIVFSGTNNLQLYKGTNGGSCSAVAASNTTSGTLRAGEVWVIGRIELTDYATANGTDLSGTTTYAEDFNGDDALQVYLGGVLQDVFGTCGNDPGSAWTGSGVSTANQNIQTTTGICTGTTSNWTNPSLRFETVSTVPVSNYTGFGNAPTSCSGCAAPVTQASAFTFNTVTGNSMNVNWTNGSGAGRVVIMNTSNTFTAPADGSNPGASTAWANAGQQVVFNGTGSGPISITGLASSTAYWYRVYEYCSPDRNYNTTTATNNPLSQSTTASSITSANNGDWFTGATWVGGVVPGNGDNVSILHNITSGGAITRNGGTFTTVSLGSSLAVAAVYTNNGTTTINGTFQLNAGGWATGTNFVYGAAGSLNFNNTSAYGVNNGDVFWPAASSPFNVSVLQGGLTMNSASRTVPGLFLTASGVTLNGGSVLTLSGTCQINGGGFFNQSPTYSGAASTLIYNVGAPYGTFNEWTGGGNTTPTVGVGVPGNVVLSLASTNVTLAGARGIPGNLTVNPSTTFTLNGGAGDFFIGGNFIQNGTLVNNNRAFQFVQSAAQTITASSANVFFDYFLINKPAGSLMLSATDITINTTAGDVVQFLNTGSLDLNGRTLNLNNGGGNILSNGGARNINSGVAGAIINVNGDKNFTFSGASPSLNLASNITVRLNNAGVNFGTNSTLNGVLQVNLNGFVQVGGAPFYGVGSTLQYNSGTNYGRGNEWISNVSGVRGYPHNILVSNNTNVIPGANAGTNTSWEAGGNLTVDAGSGFFLDFGTDDMNEPIRFLGNINISGGLSLSDNINGDLKVRGDLTFTTGSTFNPKNRAVFFTKNGTQIINAPSTVVLHYMVFEPVSGNTFVQISPTADLSVTAPAGGNAISFTSGDRIIINGRTLTIGSTGVANTITGAGTFTGSTASNITLRGLGRVGTLSFTAGSQVLGTFTLDRQSAVVAATLGSPLNINNIVFLTNGILSLGSNNLTLNASASTSGASANSYIAADVDAGTGELRKTFTSNGAFTFPVGDITAPNGNQYSPATVTFASGTYSSAYVGIRVRDIIHPNNPTATPSISRYWAMSSSGITSPNYTFAGTYTAADINGVEANSFAGRWNGSTWLQGAAAGSNNFSLAGLTTLTATNEFTGGVFICSAPGNAAAVTVTNPSSSTLDINWTNGAGAGRVVTINTSNIISAPADGSNPAASLAYGGGQQVIFNGTGSGPITVTGLNALTTYYVRVFEYCSPDRNYASGTTAVNGTTLAAPEPTNYPTVFSCGTTTTTTIPLTWTDASAGQLPDGYLIKWSSGGFGAIAPPIDLTFEANGPSTQNVAQGVGNYTVTGLTNNTTYYFKIWSYTNSGVNINYKLIGEPQTFCATIPAPWEDFEIGTKGSYALGTVTCTAGDWILDDCLIGGIANDRKNGLKSTRVQNTGRVEMDFDITVGGIEQFTVLHAAFGSDGNSNWILEASTNAGGSWTQYGGTITTSSTTLTPQSFTLSLPAPVRIRLVKTSGGGNRVNFDDMSYTVYAGCTAPAGQASGITATNPTSTGIDFNWTAGGGSDGTLVTVRPNSAGLVAPISGSVYAATTNYATAAQLNPDNRAMFRNSGSSVSGLTGLTPETQYTATAYSYANTGSCYNLPGPSSTSFWTLSTEPIGHSASFTASAVAFNQIDLSFNAANLLANADGYIIMRRTAAAPTGLPVDATAYTVGATIGDATVAAIITNSASTSASITGLSATTQYYFTLIPFNWNGSQGLTYNYRTSATIPGANATTLVQPAILSDIINDGTYSYPSNIDYTIYQSNPITNTGSGLGGSIGVWRFTIRDGGGANDLDGLPTILQSITFSSVVGIASIRTAALFDGNSLVSNAATVNTGGGTIAFSGLSYSCPHNSTRNLTLRVTFNLSPIVDNEQMQFTVLNADVAAAAFSTSSLFTNFAAISSSVASNNNSIAVVGTELAFVTQPISFIQNSNMSPAPTVGSVDVNGNRDFDFTGLVSITSTGTLNTSPQTATAVGPNGLATFNTIFHTATATGRSLQATASGQTLANSTNFDISNIAAGSYRTTSNGSWGSSNTATWEQFTGSWSVSAAPPTSTANVVYIRHVINTVGSFGNSVIMIVENGGFITNAASSTCASLTIENGGTFQINANLSIAIGGSLVVKDGGNLIVNFSYGNPSTSLWGGIENFEPESNLILYHWNNNEFLFLFSAPVTANTYSSNTALFGNVIIDFLSGSNSMATWIMAEAVGSNFNLTHSDLIFRSIDVGQTIRFSTNGAITATVGRDLIIESGFSSSGLVQLKTGGGLVFNVKRNVELNSGLFRVMAGAVASSNSYLNIDGDLNILSNANLDFNSTITSNSVETQINLKGDLFVAATAQFRSTNGNGVNRGFVNFTGTGDGLSPATTQTINCTSTQTSRYTNLAYDVKDGAYVRLINQDLEMNTQTSFKVSAFGVFDFGFNGSTALRLVEISGGATGTSFTLDPIGTIKITHPNGIDAGTANEGNVLTDSRAYSVSGIYHYIGKTPSQRVGDGLPSISSNKHVIVELDALTTTLSFEGYNGSSYVSIGNIGLSNTGLGLLIKEGTVIGTNTADFFGSAKLEMTGGLYRIQTNSGTIPLLSGYGSYILTGGTIEMNAIGNQVLSGAIPSFYNLSVTGANIYLTDAKTITSNIIVNNNVTISGTSVFDIENRGMTGTAGLTMNSGRLRMSKLNTSLPELSAVSTPYNLTGGIIEWYGSSSAQQQQISGGISYANMVINALASNYSTPAAAGNVDATSSFSITGTLTVNSPAVLRLDATDNITGTGNITLTAGSGLLYGSAEGLNLTGTTVSDGNIRISGTRTFPNTASYGFVGASDMTTGDALPSVLGNLYLFKTDPTAMVSLEYPIEVNVNLTMNSGLIDLNGNNLIIGNTSTNGNITGGSVNSYVVSWLSNAPNGILRRYSNTFTSYFFPVGDENFYSPVTVNLTGASATLNPYLDAAVAAIPHPNIGTATTYINRYWTVEPTGITDPTYNVNLSYVAADVVGVEATLYPFKWNPGGWVGAGGSPSSAVMGTGSVNTGAKTLNWSGLFTFSEFTGIGDGSPLPIELLSFSAKPSAGSVDLEWTTSSEINNNYFVVERSQDLVVIEELEKVQGAGNSNVIRNYKQTDSNPYNGVSYYRLSQYDFNGDVSRSDWVAIQFEESLNLSISFFNVQKSTRSIEFALNSNGEPLQVELLDTYGRTLSTSNLATSGTAINRIAVGDIASGVYYLRVITDKGGLVVRKFVW
ncbi:MAG: T9SS type A sorting domain-containing protein [Bacteroidia bacterium]